MRPSPDWRTPNVAAVYDVGRYRQGIRAGIGARMPYLVMEFVEGVTLHCALRRCQHRGWPAAAHICGQVAAALEAAHNCGVVHRDKPANVMPAKHPDRVAVKLVDFGLAASAGQAPATPSGLLIGTPAYMARNNCVANR